MFMANGIKKITRMATISIEQEFFNNVLKDDRLAKEKIWRKQKDGTGRFTWTLYLKMLMGQL